MSGAERYRKILSALLPAGVLGMSILLGSTGANAALDVSADPQGSLKQQVGERLAAIRKEVEALPERQRMAVLMHKYQGMDYKEISKVLKLSESATKSLLFRAYETLRETLKQFV